MIRYNIRIAYGNENNIDTFYFVYKDFNFATKEEQDKAFDTAIKELNFIYSTYGRFATKVGITRLFNHFGFELSYK